MILRSVISGCSRGARRSAGETRTSLFVARPPSHFRRSAATLVSQAPTINVLNSDVSASLKLLKTPSQAAEAVLLLFLAGICSSCSAAKHAKLPAGYVDVPAAGKQVVLSGNYVIEGWALSDDGIDEVAIYVDRQYVSSAQTGGPRPDVAAAFPKETHAAESGWRAPIGVTNLAVGPHDFVVQAVGKNGARRDIGAFHATVVK